MKNFSAEKSPPLDADSAEMESADMLDSLTQRSVLNRRYQQLQRRFVVISVLCGVFLLLSVIMVAVNVSNKGKSKSGSESGTSLPNASYCRAFMMSANAGNYGGRLDLHGAWSLPEICHDFTRDYMENQYHDDVREAIEAAKTQLVRVLSESPCSATSQCLLILDIDETSLSNYPHIKEVDFGYDSDSWHKWLAQAAAPSIAPTLGLYKNMTAQGVHVAFITGRSSDFHNETAENLKNVGYTGFLELITKPPTTATAVEYKSQNRKKLVETYNYTIIGSVGDQWSDIMGDDLGPTVYTNKLPNPMYYVQ